MLEVLDDFKINEVYICIGVFLCYVFWGELMSIWVMKLGVVGVVVDGYVRDIWGIF